MRLRVTYDFSNGNTFAETEVKTREEDWYKRYAAPGIYSVPFMTSPSAEDEVEGEEEESSSNRTNGSYFAFMMIQDLNKRYPDLFKGHTVIKVSCRKLR